MTGRVSNEDFKLIEIDSEDEVGETDRLSIEYKEQLEVLITNFTVRIQIIKDGYKSAGTPNLGPMMSDPDFLSGIPDYVQVVQDEAFIVKKALKKLGVEM